jgi:TolB-like protein/Tfp pilus assembly protein PilF
MPSFAVTIPKVKIKQLPNRLPQAGHSMGEFLPGISTPERAPEERLDSWKEIAAHLHRDVTTVQRWERREGMPVHRHLHDKRGSVYALKSELDAWLKTRKLNFEDEEKELPDAVATKLGDPETFKKTSKLPYRLSVGLAAAVLVIVTGAYFFARIRGRDANEHKIKSLAVLPLANLSGDPAQEYLADGMTEAVIGRLSMIGGLRVISRTSVLQFKDRRASVPQIANALHVDAIVEGSVIREGDRVRVHAQLIRAATDEHFWSETYDRNLGDALELESQVAQSIAEKVQVTITGAERARLVAAHPVSPDVYESYLKGKVTLTEPQPDLEKSVAYFQDAISKDTTFAPAYVGLAEAYSDLGTVLGGARPSNVRNKEISAARKALELDPNLSLAHALLANAYEEEWRWAEAETEYKRALELNPNDAVAHLGYSNWLLSQGHTDEAQRWVLRARELDPLGITSENVGWTLFLSRHYKDALRELQSETALHPDNAGAYWHLGFALSGNGQNEEAIPVLKKALALSGGSPGVMGVLVRAYARAGHRQEALQLLEELKHRQKQGYVPAAAFVNAYLGLEDTNQVFAWCNRAYDENSGILHWIKVHPFFDPVRNDPRFQELLHRVGLDQSL